MSTTNIWKIPVFFISITPSYPIQNPRTYDFTQSRQKDRCTESLLCSAPLFLTPASETKDDRHNRIEHIWIQHDVSLPFPSFIISLFLFLIRCYQDNITRNLRNLISLQFCQDNRTRCIHCIFIWCPFPCLMDCGISIPIGIAACKILHLITFFKIFTFNNKQVLL